MPTFYEGKPPTSRSFSRLNLTKSLSIAMAGVSAAKTTLTATKRSTAATLDTDQPPHRPAWVIADRRFSDKLRLFLCIRARSRDGSLERRRFAHLPPRSAYPLPNWRRPSRASTVLAPMAEISISAAARACGNSPRPADLVWPWRHRARLFFCDAPLSLDPWRQGRSADERQWTSLGPDGA